MSGERVINLGFGLLYVAIAAWALWVMFAIDPLPLRLGFPLGFCIGVALSKGMNGVARAVKR